MSVSNIHAMFTVSSFYAEKYAEGKWTNKKQEAHKHTCTRIK